MAKTVEEMKASAIQNLEEKTGKSLKDWVVIARGYGTKHGQMVKGLKNEHELTHGYANMIALKALESDDAPAAEGDALIDAQYAGAKSALRPLYDSLVASIRKFGPDVELAPKKAYVSLRRKKQFGLIQPTTATRLDIGLNLKGEPATERLEPSGSFNAMVSHRVRITKKQEIDAELLAWLKRAYDLA
jgi:predicted transport protein